MRNIYNTLDNLYINNCNDSFYMHSNAHNHSYNSVNINESQHSNLINLNINVNRSIDQNNANH